SDEVVKFISRPGFGAARVPEPSLRQLELPVPDAVPFRTLPKLSPAETGETVFLVQGNDKQLYSAEDKMPTTYVLSALHANGRYNFLNPSTFGHVKDREHVAGFRSHEFRHMPVLAAGQKNEKEITEQWQLRRLELVSLLVNEKAAVYVSEHLPRME